MKTIGQNLKEQREERGLSQTGLAERLGGDWMQKTVSRIENGQDMTVSQLERLVSVLGPAILLDTFLGVTASADFIYLANESRIHESRQYVLEALKLADHNRDILKGALQALE
ncbi:MAG: helix-turn-helix domain-containing protein [Actinomycetota bacterium]